MIMPRRTSHWVSESAAWVNRDTHPSPESGRAGDGPQCVVVMVTVLVTVMASRRGAGRSEPWTQLSSSQLRPSGFLVGYKFIVWFNSIMSSYHEIMVFQDMVWIHTHWLWIHRSMNSLYDLTTMKYIFDLVRLLINGMISFKLYMNSWYEFIIELNQTMNSLL